MMERPQRQAAVAQIINQWVQRSSAKGTRYAPELMLNDAEGFDPMRMQSEMNALLLERDNSNVTLNE
jgi:hypothetical protein